jgi:hypothetical protein
MPNSAFYDPTLNIFGTSSLFVALEGKGVERIDAPFATLGAASVVWCPVCGPIGTGSGGAAGLVSVQISPLGTTIPLRLDPDGMYRGSAVFDMATVGTLRYQFNIDGQTTKVFTHVVSKAEKETGIATLTNALLAPSPVPDSAALGAPAPTPVSAGAGGSGGSGL